LITNNLVLTAHHCIVERDAKGEILESDLPSSAIEVELGGDYLPWGTVKVRAVVAPACGYEGGHGDIAVLVLARKLVGLGMMRARLADPPTLGETIDPVGFGRCPLSNDGIHRIRREGGPIQKIGGGAVFAAASICPGDSGGPARSRATGEVLGVVSAGVMDDDDQTRDPTTFTRLDVWRPLFATAQLIVDGSSPAEVPPVGGCLPE
jgi:V8-like Glu-specific endopeptidase